jgi:hypothetical protein
MTMDHAEALERMEIAAAEPDGLERLMAGDTPDAAAVAGHLAGCPACVGELARLRQVAGVARQVIVEAPDPALRERTLAFVRANGVVRGSATVQPAPALETVALRPGTAPGSPARRRRPLAWVAGIAAALLLAGVVGYGLGGRFAKAPPHDDSAIAVLADAANTALDLAAEPDTQVVALSATPAGGAASGRLAFSGGSGDLVAVASGLAVPAAGAEYGCWVEWDGERRRLGTMYAAGAGAWAWSGSADGLDALPPGTMFGVSLVTQGGGQAVPVLTGGI